MLCESFCVPLSSTLMAMPCAVLALSNLVFPPICWMIHFHVYLYSCLGLFSWVLLPQIDPLEREWIQALIDGNLDSIRRIIMEDSTYINHRGFLHGWVSRQIHRPCLPYLIVLMCVSVHRLHCTGQPNLARRICWMLWYSVEPRSTFDLWVLSCMNIGIYMFHWHILFLTSPSVSLCAWVPAHNWQNVSGTSLALGFVACLSSFLIAVYFVCV